MLIVVLRILHAASPAPGSWLSARAWVILVAILLLWDFEGALVGEATRRWRAEIKGRSENELAAAGLWIGRLERFLILLFVLGDHFEAIGFLVAAKSIFRFSSAEHSDRRKESEYFLVGTLLSFTLALLTALAAQAALGRI
jgi:hypothetical protein